MNASSTRSTLERTAAEDRARIVQTRRTCSVVMPDHVLTLIRSSLSHIRGRGRTEKSKMGAGPRIHLAEDFTDCNCQRPCLRGAGKTSQRVCIYTLFYL
jgi:hypothetical protein